MHSIEVSEVKIATFHFICGYLRSRSPSLAIAHTTGSILDSELALNELFTQSFLSCLICKLNWVKLRSLQFPPKKSAFNFLAHSHTHKLRHIPFEKATYRANKKCEPHTHLTAHLLQQVRANLSLQRPQHAIPTINVRGWFFSHIVYTDRPVKHFLLALLHKYGFCCKAASQSR
jgi:hypothetical protein